MADPAASLPLSSQHIFHGGRLAAFSDAVFSIIATFSVIPLKFSRGIVLKEGGYRHFNLEDYLFDQWPKYLVYLYSFALVADVWFIHCGVFSIVEKVDDPINWLNLLLLFIVSFVPYATGLISNYASSLDSEQIAISICAGVIFCFSINLQTRCRAKKKKLKKKISPSIQTSPERVESPLLENRSPILEASMQLQATKDVFV